jgi:hypothetical protein
MFKVPAAWANGGTQAAAIQMARALKLVFMAFSLVWYAQMRAAVKTS